MDIMIFAVVVTSAIVLLALSYFFGESRTTNWEVGITLKISLLKNYQKTGCESLNLLSKETLEFIIYYKGK